MEARLKQHTKARQMTDIWRGLDRRDVIQEGSWSEACNLSSDRYPLLTVRRNRAQAQEVDRATVGHILAACGRDELVILDDSGGVWAGGHRLQLLEGTAAQATVEEVSSKRYTAEVSNAETLAALYEDEYQTDVGLATITYDGWRWALGQASVEDIEDMGITITPLQPLPLRPGDYIRVYVSKVLVNPDTRRQIVAMGAYVIVLPDRRYVNVIKLAAGETLVEGEDYGDIDQSNHITTDVELTVCDLWGHDYQGIVVSATEPAGHETWIDTSGSTPVLREWSVSTSTWVVIPAPYVRVEAPGIAAGLRQWDGITFDLYNAYAMLPWDGSGEPPTVESVDESSVEGQVLKLLAGTHAVYAVDPAGDWLVIPGLLPQASYTVTKQYAGTVYPELTVARRMPDMDYIVEVENRLWGCKYGRSMVQDEHLQWHDEAVNEIYACKLGDFRNWRCYLGLSTDSYTASRGSDGPYTGAAVLDGHPLFFKESCVEKVFPSASGAHQIQTQTLDGVQAGCDRSLVVIDDRLYYKAPGGVMVYTGTLPTLISAPLGRVAYWDAVGGRHGKKLYLAMARDTGRELLCYDTVSGIWHREDAPWSADEDPGSMVTWHDSLYYTKGHTLYRIDGGADCKGVSWYAESGIMGLDVAQHKWIGRIAIRCRLELGASVRAYIMYDESGHWQRKGALVGTRLHSGTLVILPRRCDTFRLRLEGTGGVEIYSMVYERERGSDVP